MCRHFLSIPMEEIYEILAGLKAAGAAFRDVYPKAQMPVLVPGKTRLEAKAMQWGYPVSWQKDVVFNTRSEKALAPQPCMWTDSVRQRRCLVPSAGFFEPHGTETTPSPKTGKPIKVDYRFGLPGGPLVFMAGIYEEDHFSILTTAANRWMAPVHPRMPMVLLPGEHDQWLHGDYEKLADRGNLPLVKQPA